jgi:hypothetical protein
MIVPGGGWRLSQMAQGGFRQVLGLQCRCFTFLSYSVFFSFLLINGLGI